MLCLDLAQIVQQRLPHPILREILCDAFRKENVAGVAAAHYSFGDVDPNARDVVSIVNIFDLVNRSAVNPHPQPNVWLIFQRSGNFHRTLHRFLGGLKENQRHPVAGGDANKFPSGLTFPKLRSVPNRIVELLDHLALLVHEQLRITDHV